MPNYPDVNGVRTSYCSIEFSVEGVRMKGVKAINYKETTEIPKIRGTSAKPIGRTRGNVDFEGDIELYQEEWDALLPQITKLGKFGFSELSWTVAITYAEPLHPSKVKTDRLIGVRFHSPEKSNAEGPDSLTIKVQMSIMDIAWNGAFVGLRQSR